MARTLPPKRRSSIVPRYLRVPTTTGSPPPMRSTLPRPRSTPSRPTSRILAAGSRLRSHPAIDRDRLGAVDLQAAARIGADGDRRRLAAETRIRWPLRSASFVRVVVGQDLGRRGATAGHALRAALGEAHAVAPPSPRQRDQRGGGRGRRGTEHHGQGGQHLAQGLTLAHVRREARANDTAGRASTANGSSPIAARASLQVSVFVCGRENDKKCAARAGFRKYRHHSCIVRERVTERAARCGGRAGATFPSFTAPVRWSPDVGFRVRHENVDGCVFRAGFGSLRHRSCAVGAPVGAAPGRLADDLDRRASVARQAALESPPRWPSMDARVDVAEVDRHRHVAVVAAAVAPGASRSRRPSSGLADGEHERARAVVGAARRVVLDPAAELRPDQRQHAVGEAARLEVALERERASRRRRRGPSVRAELVLVAVELAVGLTVATRMPSPAPSIRASSAAPRRCPCPDTAIGVGGGFLALRRAASARG